MKSIIVELIQSDEKVNRLLNEFRSEFIEVYKPLCKKEKEITIKNADEIFRRWLYSPLVLDTYINPNYIINKISQNYYNGNYVIVPHISIEENEEKEIIFNTNYLFYSLEEHPILDDFKKIIEMCRPALTINRVVNYNKEENYDDYDEELIKGLSNNSIYYQLYLFELLERLEIIKRMKSIGCTCYQLNNKYKNVISLTGENILKAVLRETIEMVTHAINNVNFIEGLVDRTNIIKFLNNGITEDSYTSILKDVDPSDKKIINDIWKFSQGIDLKHMTSVEIIKSLGYDEIADFIIGRDLKREMDRCFTTVFSYYLGIISPNYDRPFLHYEIIKGICEAEDLLGRELFIFECDNLHDLSPLGVKLIADYHKEINGEMQKNINLDHVDAAIQTSKSQKKDLLKQFKKVKKQMLLNMK